MAKYGYDPNVDYATEINKAIAAGDYRTAGIREQQRNEKIRGEGLTQYQTTSHYADYLPRTEQINSGLDKLANPEPWSYNYQDDPAWMAMRKEYLREADRETRDTMAAAAGMTGGVPSTAAVAAGQQAGNYYRAQLADRIPELMRDDYSRYMQGRDASRADLSLLSSIEEQRAADSLGLQQFDWQKEGDLWQRNYQEKQAAIAAAMNRWETLGYADQGVADALGVPVGTSTQDAQYRAWQMQQTERGDAYDRAMTWIQMGLMPDDATLAAAGIDKSMAQRFVSQAQAQMVARSAGRTGSSGSGSRRDKDTGTSDEDKKRQQEETARQQKQNAGAAAGLITGAIGAAAASGFIDPKANEYHYNRLAQQINAVRHSGINNNNSKRVEDAIVQAYKQHLIDEATANKLGQMLDSLWLNP